MDDEFMSIEELTKMLNESFEEAKTGKTYTVEEMAELIRNGFKEETDEG